MIVDVFDGCVCDSLVGEGMHLWEGAPVVISSWLACWHIVF